MNYTNDVRTPNGYSALSIVKNGSIKVDNPSFPNYKLNFNYLKNGTIYSPEKVMFFNFSFIDNDTEIISKLENKSLFSIEIGMYFYLFKAINATYKQLIQSQNKTYSIDYVHLNCSDQFFWDSFPRSNYIMSGEENFSYNLEFIITINLHLQLDWIIYSNGVDVISYAPQIRYHIFNESKFVFDNITHRPYPPFATFSYIIWGAFDFAILVTGLVLIACSILVILYKGERNKI